LSNIIIDKEMSDYLRVGKYGNIRKELERISGGVVISRTSMGVI
jgi:hypothetical protein